MFRVLPGIMSKADFLQLIEKDINSLYSGAEFQDITKGEILKGAARHLVVTENAKRSRPWLTYIFGTAVGAKTEDMINISIAGELIHAASLLHDDVIDDASLRRGRPTVNVVHGNTIAVLGGDLLLSEAIHRLNTLDKQIMVSAVDVVRQMSISAALEWQLRDNINISEKQWMSIAYGKTAALFSWCGSAAALSQGRTAEATLFDKCGDHLGRAFQIADDLKDFYTEDEIKGKYADLKNHNPNLVVITAVAEDNALKEQIKKLWQQDEIERETLDSLAQQIINDGHVTVVLERLLQEIQSALDVLKDVKQPGLREELLEWVNKLYASMDKNATGDAPGLADISNLIFAS